MIDLDDMEVDRPKPSPRASDGPSYKRSSELVVAPDCGMKYLPRDVAFGKLEALAAGAAIVRAETETAARRESASMPWSALARQG